MMIAGVSSEITRARGLGNEKAEQVKVKVPARFQIRRVEAEVAQSPDLEGPVQGNAADVIFFRRGHVGYSAISYSQSMLSVNLIERKTAL